MDILNICECVRIISCFTENTGVRSGRDYDLRLESGYKGKKEGVGKGYVIVMLY